MVHLERVIEMYWQIFLKIHTKIVVKDDWTYLDVFLFMSIPLFRLKNDLTRKMSIEVMTKLGFIIRGGEVIDVNGFMSKYCCDTSLVARQSWTPHILAGIVLHVMFLSKIKT